MMLRASFHLLPTMLPTLLPTPVGSIKSVLSWGYALLPMLPTQLAVGHAWDARARTAPMGKSRLSNFL